MAGVSVPESGGARGKKPLDSELPLVPFIDLLCSLITFLLATAVWTQIARLELKQGNAAPNQPQPSPTKSNTIDLRVEVRPTGFTVVENNKVEIPVPCKQKDCNVFQSVRDKDGKTEKELTSFYDYDGLAAKLKEEKGKFPEQQSVIVVLDDHVPYNEMIKTMDTALSVGLDQPSVSGTPL